MNKQQELARASDSLDQAKNDLMGISIRLSAIEREIDVYILKERELLENINILKRKKIVALAQEFKRAKEALLALRQKLIFAYNDRSRHEKAIRTTQSLLNKAQLNYDIVVKRYENNLLHGTFRRKDGQG